MSDENKAMRLRLEASKLGEWMDDPDERDPETCGTQVMRYDEDAMIVFAEDEVTRERNRIKERVVTVMLAMHAGARLDAMADLIKELRDEP